MTDRMRRKPLEISGKVWLRKGGEHFLGGGRIGLLEMIGEHGSITKAARAVGVSYKTAWDLVDEINNLADRPLVERKTGGRGGGGTSLTPEGREMIRAYRILREEHRKFLKGLEGRIEDIGTLYHLLPGATMRVSARNVFVGTVRNVRKGAVNAEVTVALKGGATVCAVITNESADRLGLREGMEAYAIFKATSVVLGSDLHKVRTSARNLLCGTVSRVAEGPVSAEVVVALAGGDPVTAVVTEVSAKALGLKPGDHACALVKASSVIIGVPE